MIGYGVRQTITDAIDEVVFGEVSGIVASGMPSLKVFLTYDPLHLDDRQYLRVLAAARRTGALVTVHCENYGAIRWRTAALLADGRTSPKYHVWFRPSVVEREATCQAAALAELAHQPIQVFHVFCPEVAGEIARAQALGQKVWGETCPHYLVLDAHDLNRSGFEGVKFMCSPSPRDALARKELWADMRRGTLDVVSSDHSGYSYGSGQGKRVHGADAPFPGHPERRPRPRFVALSTVSEGVSKGRIDVNAFVRLTTTNAAKPFSFCPRKSMIAPGTDADLVLWDPAKRVTGWPVATVGRGKVVMRDGVMQAEPGTGRFLAREPHELIRPTRWVPGGFDASGFLV